MLFGFGVVVGGVAVWFGKDYIVAAIAKVKGVFVKVKADL